MEIGALIGIGVAVAVVLSIFFMFICFRGINLDVDKDGDDDRAVPQAVAVASPVSSDIANQPVVIAVVDDRPVSNKRKNDAPCAFLCIVCFTASTW